MTLNWIECLMFCMNRVFRSLNAATNRSEAGSRHWFELHSLSISCLDRASLVWSSFIHYTREQYTDFMWLAQGIVQFCGTAIKLRTSNNCDTFASLADDRVTTHICLFNVWDVTHTILFGESLYGVWSVNIRIFGKEVLMKTVTLKFYSVVNEYRNLNWVVSIPLCVYILPKLSCFRPVVYIYYLNWVVSIPLCIYTI